ncbi:MAG: hypothetical protein VW576_02435 [Opitutae bacterium]
MKNLFIWCVACFASISLFASWKPDEKAAFFSVKPDQVLGSPYFHEVLNTYGLIGFGYTTIMNDHHLVDLQKEMGVQIKETSELSFVVGNFMETISNYPVSTSGNYQALNNSSLTLIVKTKGVVSPDTFFEKFDRWASGPAFGASDIERFRRDARIEPDKIDEMSTRPRVKKKYYTGMERSEKVGESTLFSIPAGALYKSLQNSGKDEIKITLGMETDKGTTTFALGSRKSVLGFFENENKEAAVTPSFPSDHFASFSLPLDGDLLRQMESNQLSDPNGPLGPLATTLGEAMYQINEVSGGAKLSGGRAHFDLTLKCENSESAQSIWSVAQASLGMVQLNVLREQMRDPRTQPMFPLSFLNAIKLKHQGNEVLVHVEALPAELFPWVPNKKFP